MQLIFLWCSAVTEREHWSGSVGTALYTRIGHLLGTVRLHTSPLQVIHPPLQDLGRHWHLPGIRDLINYAGDKHYAHIPYRDFETQFHIFLLSAIGLASR